MIKVELTKNIFNQRGGGLFGLKPIVYLYFKKAESNILKSTFSFSIFFSNNQLGDYCY